MAFKHTLTTGLAEVKPILQCVSDRKTTLVVVADKCCDAVRPHTVCDCPPDPILSLPQEGTVIGDIFPENTACLGDPWHFATRYTDALKKSGKTGTDMSSYFIGEVSGEPRLAAQTEKSFDSCTSSCVPKAKMRTAGLIGYHPARRSTSRSASSFSATRTARKAHSSSPTCAASTPLKKNTFSTA